MIVTKKPTATSGGTGAWAASTTTLVGDVTDGNDATYDADGTLAEDLFFAYADVTGVAVTSRILSVVVRSRLWNPTGVADGSAYIRATFNAVQYSSPLQQPATGYTNYDWDCTAQFSIATPTVAQWNAAILGAKENNYATNALRLVEQYATLDVRPMAGGLVFLLGSLGPLIAVGLHEMPKIAQAFFARTRALITPAEYETAWHELRAHRYPTHFDMRARPA